VKALRDRGRVAGFGNVVDVTASILRHFVEQVTIRRAAKAHREHARVRMLLHFRENFIVVANQTIGHETDDAHVLL
jgi:hypothetical protein